MDTRPPEEMERSAALLLIVATTQAIVAILEAVDRDYPKAVGMALLAIAFLLLATSRPQSARIRMIAVYALCAASIGIYIARTFLR